MRLDIDLGEPVVKGDVLGVISDASGLNELKIKATDTGIVIGMRMNPS